MNEVDTLNDLLNTDLSNVPTNFPVLRGGLYEFRFEAPSIVDTKKKDGNKNLKFEVVLVNPSPSHATDGREVSAGWKMTTNIYLPKGATDEKSAKAVEISKQNLASLKEALTGSKSGGFGNPEQYVGLTFTARVAVDNTPEFGERNEIKQYLPKKS